VVNRRDLDAIVRVKSGETLVLAGIIQTSYRCQSGCSSEEIWEAESATKQLSEALG
jgi:hypothetical protein